MIEASRALGRPLLSPTGELVKALMPVEPHLAPKGSLSATCGLGEFPFHTDTAFWPCPSRYLVMRVVGDLRRTTELLGFEEVYSMLEPRARANALRSVWRVSSNKGGGIYCSMAFAAGTGRGWRFDTNVMKPANASSQRALQEVNHAIRESQAKVSISWERTRCIVIDNWRLLHARGAAPSDETARVLFRIYVG